jgi:hypothetical protein
LSTASEPLFAKKNLVRLGGEIFSSLSSRPTCALARTGLGLSLF